MNVSLILTNKCFSKRAYYRGRAYNKVFTVILPSNIFELFLFLKQQSVYTVSVVQQMTIRWLSKHMQDGRYCLVLLQIDH